MPGLAVGKAAEHGGVLDLAAAGLLAMRLVVEADAKDLVGIGNYRQPADVFERIPRGLRRRSRRLRQCSRRNGGFQIGKPIAQRRTKVYRFRAVDQAPASGAIDFETCELHRMPWCLKTGNSVNLTPYRRRASRYRTRR